MTKEREEAIRRECEAEARDLHIRVIKGRYPSESNDAIIEAGLRNGSDALKAIADLVFRERLRAEDLVEAGEELRRFMRKPIALSDEGVRHVNDQWDRALGQYRRKP